MQGRTARQRQASALKKIILKLFTRQDRGEELSRSGERIISPIKLGRTADKASKIYKEISDEGKRKSY